MAISDYTATRVDELTIKKNEFVDVIVKSTTGFWKVKYVHIILARFNHIEQLSHFKNIMLFRRAFNLAEGLVPGVCLKKVIQNQTVPITLANSVRYRHEIKTKDDTPIAYSHLPPIKEDAAPVEEETSTNLISSPVNVLPKNAAELPKANPPVAAPIAAKLETPVQEIAYSIANYVDTVGDGISFDKGQKFKVAVLEKLNMSC